MLNFGLISLLTPISLLVMTPYHGFLIFHLVRCSFRLIFYILRGSLDVRFVSMENMASLELSFQQRKWPLIILLKFYSHLTVQIDGMQKNWEWQLGAFLNSRERKPYINMRTHRIVMICMPTKSWISNMASTLEMFDATCPLSGQKLPLPTL